jgi:hypothetical protein
MAKRAVTREISVPIGAKVPQGAKLLGVAGAYKRILITEWIDEPEPILLLPQKPVPRPHFKVRPPQFYVRMGNHNRVVAVPRSSRAPVSVLPPNLAIRPPRLSLRLAGVDLTRGPSLGSRRGRSAPRVGQMPAAPSRPAAIAGGRSVSSASASPGGASGGGR